MSSHEPRLCIRDIRTSQPTVKGWKSKFTCPGCGRSTWQALNFLGTRKLVCDGVKFTKVPRKALYPQEDK